MRSHFFCCYVRENEYKRGLKNELLVEVLMLCKESTNIWMKY